MLAPQCGGILITLPRWSSRFSRCMTSISLIAGDKPMELDHHMNTSYIHIWLHFVDQNLRKRLFQPKNKSVLIMVFEEYVAIQIEIKRIQLHSVQNRISKRVYKYELKLTANIWLISIEDNCSCRGEKTRNLIYQAKKVIAVRVVYFL